MAVHVGHVGFRRQRDSGPLGQRGQLCQGLGTDAGRHIVQFRFQVQYPGREMLVDFSPPCRGSTPFALTSFTSYHQRLVHDGVNPSAVHGNSQVPMLARDRQIPALHGENWL